MSTVLVAMGFASFLGSKVPQSKCGEWFVFGIKYMGLGSKVFYVLGYALMIIGLAGILAIYKDTA